MAQASRIHNGAQFSQISHNYSIFYKPKSSNSISLSSKPWGSSKASDLKVNNAGLVGNCKVGTRRVGMARVSASVAAEKPSTAPEIVLQPIKEISGTITLPGSKSLSNRILLLAALSEVWLLLIL